MSIAIKSLPNAAIVFLFISKEKSHNAVISDQVEACYKRINKINIEFASGYPKGHQSHFDRNKVNILSWAEGLKGKALVVGIGNGMDIPLLKLASQFEQVTVLDIDVYAMKVAIAKLPEHLQKKIKLVQGDVTGVLLQVAHAMQFLPASLSLGDHFDLIGAFLDRALQNAQPCSLEEKYDFVVSSMLTSQLASCIDAYIASELRKKFVVVTEETCKSHSYVYSLKKLHVHLCTQHLEHLHAWTAGKGKVYYADTYKMHKFNYVINNHCFSKESATIYCSEMPICPVQIDSTTLAPVETSAGKEPVPNKEVNDCIEVLYHLHKKSEKWAWATQPPLFANDPSPRCIQTATVAEVRAFYLQPKSTVSYSQLDKNSIKV